MSMSLGAHLPAGAQVVLNAPESQTYFDRAIVICSVDENSKPHPAMLSTRELFAVDATHLSLTVHATSRTAKNLRANGHVTVILADCDGVFYLKGAAEPVEPDTLRPDVALFRVRLTDVLEDTPTGDEKARITTGIRFERTEAVDSDAT
jgi:hypothetical protein